MFCFSFCPSNWYFLSSNSQLSLELSLQLLVRMQQHFYCFNKSGLCFIQSGNFYLIFGDKREWVVALLQCLPFVCSHHILIKYLDIKKIHQETSGFASLTCYLHLSPRHLDSDYHTSICTLIGRDCAEFQTEPACVTLCVSEKVTHPAPTSWSTSLSRRTGWSWPWTPVVGGLWWSHWGGSWPPQSGRRR